MPDADAGKRLREARRRANLTQTGLAARVGAPVITISQHESGRRQMRPYWVERYAAALGASPAWLMFGEDDGANSAGCSITPVGDGRARVRVNAVLSHDMATAIMSIVYSESSRRGARTAEPDSDLRHERGVLGYLLLHPEQAAGRQFNFREPIHREIWKAASAYTGDISQLVVPYLSETLSDDPAFKMLGGVRYLADVIDHGLSSLTEADGLRRRDPERRVAFGPAQS